MEIHPIKLKVRLPDGGACGMVLAQPEVHLEQSAEAGFRIRQIDRVSSTGVINSIKEYVSTHRGQHYDHPHFILFPELSLTAEGLDELEHYVRKDAPHNTILIAGVEGLSWDSYESLLDRSDNPPEAKSKPEGPVDWANCQIICVREDDGSSKLYVQPKFVPSHFEQGQRRILEGNDLLLFRMQLPNGTDYSFISLICADLAIQNVDGSPLNQALSLVRNYSVGDHINLEFIFGLLYNESLDKEPFPTAIASTFNADHSKLDLQDTALVLVNGASATNDGSRGFGQSCFIFHSTSWKRIGPRDNSPTWYVAEDWHGTHRFRLQENTSAIHTFYYLPIRSVGRNASDKRLPFDDFDSRKIAGAGIEENLSSGLHIQWEKLLYESKDSTNAQTSYSHDLTFEGKVRAKFSESEAQVLNTTEDRLHQISDLLFQCHIMHAINYNCWNRHDNGEAMGMMLTVTALLKTLGHVTDFTSAPLTTARVNGSSHVVVMDGMNMATWGYMQAEYLRNAEKYALAISPTLVILTRTRTLGPNAEPSPATVKFSEEKATAAPSIPDPGRMHFSPSETLFGAYQHLQAWTNEGTAQEALTYLRSYVGKI